MRFIKNSELEQVEAYMAEAAVEASKSTCTKSQRGAVIVKTFEIIGRGHNKPTIAELCQPCIRKDIRDNSRVELCSAVHAEQEAILDAARNGKSTEHASLYHAFVRDNVVGPAGPPSCTVCSRIMYAAGIDDVILRQTKGYVLYDIREFQRLSFDFFLNK